MNALLDDIASSLFKAQLPIAGSEMFVSYVTDLDPGEPLPDVHRFAAAETAEILKAVGLL